MGSYTRRLGLSVPVLVGTNNLQSRVHQHHHVRRRLDGCDAFNGRLLNESHLVLCRNWYAHKSQSHLRTNAGHHQLHHAPRGPEVRRTMMRTKRPFRSPSLPFPSPLLPTSGDMSATGKFQRDAAATKKHGKEVHGKVHGHVRHLFGTEHRMRKEEREIDKEAKQGWRCAADAARITKRKYRQ